MNAEAGRALLLFDRRDLRSWGPFPGLSPIWSVGALIAAGAGRFGEAWPVGDWAEAIALLGREDARINEVHFWGHGAPGTLFIGGQALDRRALEAGHPLHAGLAALRPLLRPESLWWFRVCSAFAGAEGRAFARAWSRFFRCRVAGFTHDIGIRQSGLYALLPDQEPAWPDPDRRGSAFSAPRTITFLRSRLPAWSFDHSEKPDPRTPRPTRNQETRTPEHKTD